MWGAGLAGVVVGVLLTADAAPGTATLLGGLLGGAVGVLAARWRSVGVRWPVLVGVLAGGGAGGLVGLAVVAPTCTVDGGTLSAMCVLVGGLGGGLLADECLPRPTSSPTGSRAPDRPGTRE